MFCTGQFENHPSPRPRQTAGHLTFFEKFWCNCVAGLDGQMRHPLERQPQGKQNRLPLVINRIAYLWKRILQIFSHYEFLVQFVFASRFKQGHIPRYKYIKQQQQKNQRGIDKSNGLWTRLTRWIKELQNPFDSERWKTFWPESQMPHRGASFWVKFPTVRSLTWVTCPGIARGVGFGIDWYITESRSWALTI